MESFSNYKRGQFVSPWKVDNDLEIFLGFQTSLMKKIITAKYDLATNYYVGWGDEMKSEALKGIFSQVWGGDDFSKNIRPFCNK